MPNMEWGFLIATDLFFGGLSAGLFIFSVTILFARKEGRYPHIARVGALLAPWPVMAATAILLADLGHWYRFYKLLLHFRVFSPMSMGTWILSGFIAVALLYCYSWLEPGERDRLFGLLPKKLSWMQRLNRDLSYLRQRLALIGTPLALGAVLYPGLLLGVVQARPFWNNSLIAQLFVVSAATVACAVLILTGYIPRIRPVRELNLLHRLNVALLALELGVVCAFVLYGSVSLRPTHEALRLILGGPFTAWFWFAFVGMGVLVPLTVTLARRVPKATEHDHALLRLLRYSPVAAPVLVVLGGYLLRCLVIFAGQRSAI